MPNANRTIQGTGKVYIAAYNAASVEALPADTTARDGSWGGNWVDLGWTSVGGIKLTRGDEQRHIEVDQSTIEVRSHVTKQDVQVEVQLKECTVENLRYALGYGTLSTSGSSQVLTVANNPTLTEYTIGLEMAASSSVATEAQRIIVYRTVAVSEPELVVSREEEMVIQATFKGLLHGTSSLMQVRNYRSSTT